MSQFRHHDAAGEAKRREAAFEHWRAQILREAGNQASLARAKARVLADRKLGTDPQLLAMVRSFIAERESYFARSQAAPRLPTLRSTTAQPSRIEEPHPPPPPLLPQRTPRDEAVDRLKALDRKFHDYAAHFDEARARTALDAMLAIRGQFTDLIDEPKVGEYTAMLQRLADRRLSFETHIEKVTGHAISAIRQGDHEAAVRFLKRLVTIHAAYPRLLPDSRFVQIRAQIANASDHHENRLAAQKLLGRERAVAAEIKQIASAIHQFHGAARTLPHDAVEYARTEAAYHRAVAAVKSHETEWLAGLILELVDLLNEMHGQPGRAQAQVDHFLASVRAALSRLRQEIGVEEKRLDSGRLPTP